MIREFFTSLRAVPSIPASDPLGLARECARVCDLLIDFLRNPETLPPQPSIPLLMTLMWRLIGNHEIPMVLDPSGGNLPSVHLFCIVRRSPRTDTVFYALPYTFLELVRTDPLMQLCAMINMGSQGCDYYSQHLDPHKTPQRAQAYEAELLLALQPLLGQEGLPFELNAYLQGVLKAYPVGLDSLPAEQRYTPPSYPK